MAAELGSDGATTGESTPVLSLQHASKSFGPIHAVEDVSIDLFAGEAHALVGENGAGKSTLVKIFAGVHTPDSGRLLVNGVEVALSGPAAAIAAGIAVIYQEPTLFPDLTVVENIFIGRQPLLAGRRIDRGAMSTQARAIFKRLGVPLDPDRIARGLSIAEQQLVEIAKALSLDARVIVMDEPTAALSAVEVERLFGVAATLRESGVAVLFISHRLEEVFALCQRVTVLRDGRLVLARELAGLTGDDLIRAMVGRDLPERVTTAQTLGEHGAPRRAAESRGRVPRHQLRRAGRRDRRAGGPGRRRPQRGCARDLRHRLVRRGLGGGGRPAPAALVSVGGDERRCRSRAGGSPPAGAGHELVDHAEHRARVAQAPESRWG